MGLYDHWPYTNFHELNLSWLLRKMEYLSNVVENFVALNTIKYADPIQWNITTQYEANTVVVDPQTGTAYISTQPVPSGVGLTNTDYWSVIFTLDVISANKNITLRDDGSNVLATFGSVAGDWLLWNGTLYRVSQAINVNEAYVVGYNLTRYTVEMFISDYVTELKTEIGDLTDLNTADKTNLVAAINEVLQSVGDLTDLNTTDKDNLVNAINEVLQTLTSTVGDLTDLNTTDKDSVVNAINEVYGMASDVIEDVYYLNVKDFGAVGDGITDDTQAVQAAINAATNKAVILFPVGTFVLNGSIEIYDSKYIRIFGIYRRSKITRTIQTADPIFKVGDGVNTVGGFECSHLYFENISAHAYCFLIRSTQTPYIHRCRIFNVENFVKFGQDATDVANAGGVIEFIEGKITSSANSIFCCIMANSNGVILQNNAINSERGTSNIFCECSPLTSYDTLIMKNNFVQRMQYGLVVQDTRAASTLQNFFIYNNIFDGIGENCILFRKRNANGMIVRVFMHDNWFSVYNTMTGDCIIIDRGNGAGYIGQVSINDNSFILCPRRAVIVANCTALNINDNKINGFNANLDGADSAIYSAITILDSTSVSIIDNQLVPSADLPVANKWGLYIGNSTNVILNGNALQGVTNPLTGTATIAVGNLPVSINT